jgi:hypothetical protein
MNVSRSITRLPRAAALAALVALAQLLAGCNIQPWVKPYERELLADPLMNSSRDPFSDTYLEHVNQVREAARGATGAEGGGCGCN